MAVTVLAFGSNLGDRPAALAAALARLADAGVVVAARSALYETDPVTPDPQPLYLNAAARIETTLDPYSLLRLCLEVELALGRARPTGRTHAPRTIDIDLLLYGDTVLDDPPMLVLPHPRLLDRPFVRIPLADVSLPGLAHPVTGAPLDRVEGHAGVRRVSG